MDRRQLKTRTAIFTAFITLLAQKGYDKITVQDIIDAANIGRTTFYAHFETKDELLKALCQELFQHLLHNGLDCTSNHWFFSDCQASESIFCHLLHHLQRNDNNVLQLLSCTNNDIFLRYFKDSLNEVIEKQFVERTVRRKHNVPENFLINHISGSFVEMVLWWIKSCRRQTPEELDTYFRSVIEPIL